ncbi:tetratricopeptide repeat protein [Candidatus Thorarchaeota archaeon]|nr:MAG: tetratricopeptide repeat protein [Candidatus Thorarchaeota archaeon]
MPSVQDALDEIEKHLEENPDDAAAWNSKGVLLADKKDFGAALRALERAIRLNPELAEAYTNRGRVLISIGPENAKKALDSFNTALELSPDNVQALKDKAFALRIVGKSQQELETIHRLLDRVPDQWGIWIRRGDLELEIGRTEQSIDSYNRALEINPDAVPALVHRGIAFSLIEEWGDAIDSAKRATELAPEELEPWRVLGDIYLRAEKFGSAMKALQEAAHLDPDDPTIENTMGMAAFKRGHEREAIKHFKRALVKKRDYAPALKNLGFISMEIEEWEQARKAWKRLTRLVKDDPAVWNAAATTYAKLNDFCSAADAWEKARKMLKRKGKEKAAERIHELHRAARINCSKQKKAERERRKQEKATRSFRDRFSLRKKRD